MDYYDDTESSTRFEYTETMNFILSEFSFRKAIEMVRWIQWFLNTYLNFVNSPHIMCIELAPASASCRVGENNL